MKTKNIVQSIVFASISSLFIMASCEEELIGPQPTSSPIQTFDSFWKTFDEHYGLFEVKKIDWNAIRDQFRPLVNEQTTDEQLYEVLTNMMVLLNDNHLNLYPTNGTLPVFPGGVLSYRNGELKILKAQEDYDLEVAKKYTRDYIQITENIGYGNLPNNLLYINIKGTDGLNEVEKKMEAITQLAASSQGVVIDIRGFYGGYDPVSQYLAGCFASSNELYMTTKKRNGSAHSDFTETFEWYVEPQFEPFSKPIIVLTSRFTQSAGETFDLAIKQFDHVKTLGDTTAGSFSDNPNFDLPNGWMISVSVGDYRAANGKSYEGIGLAPDEFLVNSKDDLLANKDIVLEKAIELLKK